MATTPTLHKDESPVLPLILATAVLLFAIHHVFKWDVHGVEIVQLKAKEHLSKLTPQDLGRIIYICQSRAQASCLEKYQKMKAMRLGNPAPYYELATYFTGRKPEKAVMYFNEYFKNKGQDVKAAYEYALLLQKFDRQAEALKYLQFAVHRTRQKQPIMIRSYVVALIKNNQWTDAKVWIERVRSMSKESIYFMEPEMRSIEQRISSQSRATKRPATI